MKQIFTAILLTAFFALPATAQQMLIDKGNDNIEVIDLDNFKQITFAGTIVNIEQADGSTSSASMSEINRIYFTTPSSIDEVQPGCKELVSYITHDAIAVNAPAGCKVSIYNIVGVPVLDVRLQREREAISIANLPQGVYIIKTDERTAKIVRR